MRLAFASRPQSPRASTPTPSPWTANTRKPHTNGAVGFSAMLGVRCLDRRLPSPELQCAAKTHRQCRGIGLLALRRRGLAGAVRPATRRPRLPPARADPASGLCWKGPRSGRLQHRWPGRSRRREAPGGAGKAPERRAPHGRGRSGCTRRDARATGHPFGYRGWRRTRTVLARAAYRGGWVTAIGSPERSRAQGPGPTTPTAVAGRTALAEW